VPIQYCIHFLEAVQNLWFHVLLYILQWKISLSLEVSL
jgi:hypothetical protein